MCQVRVDYLSRSYCLSSSKDLDVFNNQNYKKSIVLNEQKLFL